MIAQIASSRIDYEGKQIFEATVYTDGQLWPPVLIAISNTGLQPLKKTVRRFAKKRDERVKFERV